MHPASCEASIDRWVWKVTTPIWGVGQPDAPSLAYIAPNFQESLRHLLARHRHSQTLSLGHRIREIASTNYLGGASCSSPIPSNNAQEQPLLAPIAGLHHFARLNCSETLRYFSYQAHVGPHKTCATVASPGFSMGASPRLSFPSPIADIDI